MDLCVVIAICCQLFLDDEMDKLFVYLDNLAPKMVVEK